MRQHDDDSELLDSFGLSHEAMQGSEFDKNDQKMKKWPKK